MNIAKLESIQYNLRMKSYLLFLAVVGFVVGAAVVAASAVAVAGAAAAVVSKTNDAVFPVASKSLWENALDNRMSFFNSVKGS